MKMPTTMPGAEPFFLPGRSTGCLLIHGFTGTPFEMRALGEHLNKEGHTVLGIRLSAHGTKPDDMIRARWRDWVASVEDGWNLLSGSTNRIFIMGLSMGGMLSLLYASYAPAAGIVVIATPHHLPDDPRLRFVKPLSIIKPYMPKGESDWFDEEADSSHMCYPVDPTRSYAELPELVEAMQAGLPSVKAPILLIYSKDDQMVLAKDGHMDHIYKAVGSQDKNKLWIEKSGHVLTRDAQRETVFKACADFVARINTTNN